MKESTRNKKKFVITMTGTYFRVPTIILAKSFDDAKKKIIDDVSDLIYRYENGYAKESIFSIVFDDGKLDEGEAKVTRRRIEDGRLDFELTYRISEYTF